jgi:hypothetical protein
MGGDETLQFVAAVVEEGARYAGQNQTSLAYRSGWGGFRYPPSFKRSTAFRKLIGVEIGGFWYARRMRPGCSRVGSVGLIRRT